MPLPTKNKTEKDKEFISRCLGNSVMNKEFPDQKRRAAVCYSLLKKSKQRKKAKGSNESPTWEDDVEMNGFFII